MEEDILLLMGWSRDGTTYEINGLYNAAGNTDAGADFTTKANIETSVLALVAKLEADGIYPPYNMVLNPTQFAETQATIANTGIKWADWIKSVIEGDIFQTPALTVATGMILKTGATAGGMFEYVMAEDLSVQTEVESLKEGQGLYGKVYVRGLPVVYDANSIGTLTAI